MTKKNNQFSIEKKVEELFKLKAHLGHKKNRLHPKAKKFVYQVINGTTIIDLVKTVDLLEKAKNFLNNLKKENKKVVFVATKKNAASIVANICQKNKISYVSTKWPAGFLTNFSTLLKNIEKLKKMREEKDTGQWNKFTKHEQIKLNKKLKRLEHFYQGLIDLEKIPDAIVIVDIKKEKTALTEAKKTNIPVLAIVDTNVNPDLVNYPIPANDDAPETIKYLINELAEVLSNKNDR